MNSKDFVSNFKKINKKYPRGFNHDKEYYGLDYENENDDDDEDDVESLNSEDSQENETENETETETDSITSYSDQSEPEDNIPKRKLILNKNKKENKKKFNILQEETDFVKE